jgi:hypothetical protein
VVSDVAARLAAIIDLVESARKALERLLQLPVVIYVAATVPGIIRPYDLNEIHDVTLFDRDAAVHEGLGEAQAWGSQYIERHASILKAERDVWEIRMWRSEHLSSVARFNESHYALLYEPTKNGMQ